MKVRIYAQRESGPEELGAIVLKHGKLVQEPTSIALTNLLSEPLVIYEKATRILIDPEEEPKKFLEHLTKAVRGSYVWAGEMEE
jgi:hypothetical protein